MQDSGLKVCARLRMPIITLGIEQNFRLGLRDLKNHIEDSQYLDSGLMVSTAVPWDKHKANLRDISRIINAEDKEPGGKALTSLKAFCYTHKRAFPLHRHLVIFATLMGNIFAAQGTILGISWHSG